jgi:hypothetical protein
VDIEKYELCSLQTHKMKAQHPSEDWNELEMNNNLTLLKNGVSQPWNKLI